MQAREDVTDLLIRWHDGDDQALEKIIPAVQQELKSLASSYLRRERANHTLQTTALVNEAFLRLVDQRRVGWEGRNHFIAIAARMMRRILVDHARSLSCAKRDSGHKVSFNEFVMLPPERTTEILELDDALVDLAKVAPRQALIVELRYFGGLTRQEVASALGISVPTVTRHWRTARAWLFRNLSGDLQHGP